MLNNKVLFGLFGFSMILVGLFAGARYMWGPLPSTSVMFAAVPAKIDPGMLTPLNGATMGVYPDKSVYTYDFGGKTEVTFYVTGSKIDVNGNLYGVYNCNNGGSTVHVVVTSLHLYYDCLSRQIFVSRIAYPTTVVDMHEITTQGNITWALIDGDLTLSGWPIKFNAADGSLAIRSPFGEDLLVSEKGVFRLDGDAYLKVAQPASGYIFTAGTAPSMSILILSTPGGWVYQLH